MQNSFSQKVFLTIFFGFCAAGVVQFYKHMIWKANEEINGADRQRVFEYRPNRK